VSANRPNDNDLGTATSISARGGLPIQPGTEMKLASRRHHPVFARDAAQAEPRFIWKQPAKHILETTTDNGCQQPA
jgi:hypothetical protein